MIPVFVHSCFLDHLTGPHPECPERLLALAPRLQQLEREGLVQCRQVMSPSVSPIAKVHSLGHIEAVQTICVRGGGWLDSDTRLSPGSFAAALTASAAACQAVDEVLGGSATAAFCAIRPPGHHAESARGMGFCLFNHVAVAAQYALDKHRLNRILIVDWDVHHGNGTQEIFWERPDVGFFSIHRYPFYPGTGAAEETGMGPGLGATLNLPITFGTSRSVFLERFGSGLEQMAQRLRPELILISAGFDAYRNDPIGSLGLEVEDFGALTQVVLEVAGVWCNGRTISVLEGGYDLGGLPDCVESHLKALDRPGS
jgi:acetoin utilization deacetylase AcuC-like enzyme